MRPDGFTVPLQVIRDGVTIGKMEVPDHWLGDPLPKIGTTVRVREIPTYPGRMIPYIANFIVFRYDVARATAWLSCEPRRKRKNRERRGY